VSLRLQLLSYAKEGTAGELRTAVLDILSANAGAGSNSEALAAQLKAAVTAARPASTEEFDGALAIGKTAGRLVNVVVGVAALQLVKGVSDTVLQQVSPTAEQRLWLHVIGMVCWLSAWAHEQYEGATSGSESGSETEVSWL
jgi:hypothetical protein